MFLAEVQGWSAAAATSAAPSSSARFTTGGKLSRGMKPTPKYRWGARDLQGLLG